MKSFKNVFRLFIIFSFSSLFVLASAQANDEEEEAKRRILEKFGNKEEVQVQAKEPEPEPTETQPESSSNPNQVDTKDLEASIRETVSNLQVTEQGRKEAKGDHYKPRELKDSYLTGVMDEMMKEMLKKVLKENPLSKMTKGEVRSLIEAHLNNLPAGNMFRNNPKLLDFFVDWLRDKRALPKFLGIVNKPDRVKTYGLIVFCVFIVSFLLNLFNSKGGLLKRIFKKLLIVFSVAVTNLIVFYIMFQPNVQPTIDIILKYIHL